MSASVQAVEAPGSQTYLADTLSILWGKGFLVVCELGALAFLNQSLFHRALVPWIFLSIRREKIDSWVWEVLSYNSYL